MTYFPRFPHSCLSDFTSRKQETFIYATQRLKSQYRERVCQWRPARGTDSYSKLTNGGKQMRRSGLMIACAILTLTFAAVAFAQSGDEKDLPYVKRTTLAVRYAENKKTSVNLTGTSLAPRVLG